MSLASDALVVTIYSFIGRTTAVGQLGAFEVVSVERFYRRHRYGRRTRRNGKVGGVAGGGN